MMGRVLRSAQIPAAQQAFALLIERIAAVGAQGRSGLRSGRRGFDVGIGERCISALRNGTASQHRTAPAVLVDIRENAIRTILSAESRG